MAVIREMVYNTDMTIEETIAEIKRKALREKVPIMEDEGLDFLCDFLKEHRINSLLEVGTAVGYSSIMMAHHNPQLKILTLEQDGERYHQAVENIERCGLLGRINPVLTNAREFETDEKFDVIFLDGPKAHNQQLFERFEGNLNPAGYFIIDDVWFHGFIEHPELIRSRRLKPLVEKLDEFVKNMMSNPEYRCTYLKIGDGVLVAARKEKTNE